MVNQLEVGAVTSTVGNYVSSPIISPIKIWIIGLKIKDKRHFWRGEAEDFAIEVVVIVAASVVVSHKSAVVVLGVGA